jgi:site-specific recombinase XerD
MSNFQFKRGLWWFCVVGKGNKYAEIPVVNDLLQELILYRTSLGLTKYPTPSEINIPLVANSYGKKMSDSMLYKTIKELAKNCADNIRDINPNAAYAIENMSTHWLRHTSATHQVDSGLDIRIVKDNLRHSMLETTMRYQHTNQDQRHQQTQEKFGTKNNK